MKIAATCCLLLTVFFRPAAQNILLHPTFQSIGVEIQDVTGYDSCSLAYKKQTETQWRTGFPPDRVTITGNIQFRGSLFLLEANTTYELLVTLFQAGIPNALPAVQVSTQPYPIFQAGNQVKWVAPNGSGNAYTESQPGDLATLFNSGQVICGVTVMFKDGIYPQNGLQLTIQNACTEGTPITLMAAPGAHPVVEGGISDALNWTQHPSDPKLYSAPIPQAAAHSNICIMDNQALYPYPSLTSEVLLGGYNLAALNFGYDGFVRDENTLWIKTQSGFTPADAVVTLSRSFRFLTVYGGNKDAYLHVKGITFRHFGKPVLNPLGSANDAYGAIVFDIRNAHHVCFDSCDFTYNTSDISFNNQCDHLLIQHCKFKHDVGKWTHAMIKKSNVFVHTFLYTVASSRARGVETAGVFLHKSRNVVIRDNLFDGLNSGIESYIDQGPMEEIDVYDNVFTDNFDALECDGYWTNLRVWNNEFIRSMAGISAAPPLIGPRYFHRNLFHGMQGRRNEQDDPYFIGCSPVTQGFKGQGIGLKTNTGNGLSAERGNLYLFNNTFHAADTLGFVFTSWDSEWRKALFVNNIYTHERSYPFFYFSLAGNESYQLQSVSDNYYCFTPEAPVAVVKHIHGQYQCSEAPDVTQLEQVLADISGSADIRIQLPKQADPMYETTAEGGFSLGPESPMIDAGILIPGFYDYLGTGPDLGAKEREGAVSAAHPEFASGPMRLFPNPGYGLYTLDWGGGDLGDVQVSGYDAAGRLVFPVIQQDKYQITLDFQFLPSGLYWLLVQTLEGQYGIRVVKI